MRKSEKRTGHRSFRIGAAAAVGAAAIMAVPAVPAFAATYTVSTSQVAITGGTFLYLQGGTAFASTQGIRFALSSGSCPSAYDTAQTGAVNGGLITARSVSVALVKTPALPAGTYKPCLYDSATTGTAYATDTTTDTVTSVNMATESAITGKATDKVTLTAPSAIFTGTTYSTEFISGATNCPTTYQTASTTVLTSTTTKTSTSVLTATVPAVTIGTSYLICSYNGTTTSSTLAARGKRNFTPYDTTLTTGTLNPTGGSSGTATTVTVTAPSTIFTGTPAALVSYNTCPTTYVAGSTNMEPYAAVTTKISTGKIAVTIPATAIVGSMDVTTPWNVCVYASASTGALVLNPITYSVAAVLSVSSALFTVGSGSAASTGSGPAQGGSSITISGLTGIPTTTGATLSATLGGSAINNITAIDATSFSGTTTAHAAGAVNLTVTTAAGTKSTTTSPYSYTYGVTITPNTGNSGTTPILDITGAGFSSLVFADVTDATALDAAKAYVLLTDNTWNAQTFSNIDALATESVSYCNSVLQISDAEIICTLDLANSIASAATNTPTFQTTDVPTGTYTVTVVNSGEDLNAADFNYSIVSSGSTFTVAPY